LIKLNIPALESPKFKIVRLKTLGICTRPGTRAFNFNRSFVDSHRLNQTFEMDNESGFVAG